MELYPVLLLPLLLVLSDPGAADRVGDAMVSGGFIIDEFWGCRYSVLIVSALCRYRMMTGNLGSG